MFREGDNTTLRNGRLHQFARAEGGWQADGLNQYSIREQVKPPFHVTHPEELPVAGYRQRETLKRSKRNVVRGQNGGSIGANRWKSATNVAL